MGKLCSLASSLHVPHNLCLEITHRLLTHLGKSKTTWIGNFCATEPGDTFHAFCRCPRAVGLWQAMAEQWRIPSAASFKQTGTEWLAQALCDLPETERMELMMTLWRCWRVRNDLTHNKPAPPVVASRRFLLSYVDSLIGLQNVPNADPMKGKQVVDVAQPRTPILHAPVQVRSTTKWVLLPAGWTKLNVDGSFCPRTGSRGAQEWCSGTARERSSSPPVGSYVCVRTRWKQNCRHAWRASTSPYNGRNYPLR